MMNAAALLALACFLVVIINESVRGKFGFISDRHFVLFWAVWAIVLVGMGVSLGLMLSDVLR